MRYGFAIDQRTGLACHAATVACKTEHGVPGGQFRRHQSGDDPGPPEQNTGPRSQSQQRFSVDVDLLDPRARSRMTALSS